MRDYLRVSDLARLPGDMIAPYDAGVRAELRRHAVFSG